MKKKPASKSAFFTPRVLITFAFCAIGVLAALGVAWSASSVAPPAVPGSVAQTTVPARTYNIQLAAANSGQVQAAQPSKLKILYSQTDHPATTANGSGNSDTVNAAFNKLAADDFVVPAGQTWTIQQLTVQGLYSKSTGAATSVNVNFYYDAAGMPGAPVSGGTYTNVAMTDAAGNFTIALPSNCVLTQGTYWVSVRANMDLNRGADWAWLDRTVQSNSGAAAQNSAGGVTSWERKSNDNIFQIGGTQVPDAVLYDQLNNPGANATNSQDFEAANAAFTNQTADDFVVPAGQTWTIQSVDVQGLYFNGTGPAASFNVYFFNNSGVLPSGAAIATRLAQPYVNNAGVFTVTLSSNVVLTAGTYWVSVQARMDFTPGGQWGWTNRTVVANSPGAWQNPGGGFAAPASCPAAGCPVPCVACPSWGRRECCTGTAAGQADQMFRLNGTVGGASSPTPTPSVSPSATRPVPTPTASPSASPSATAGGGLTFAGTGTGAIADGTGGAQTCNAAPRVINFAVSGVTSNLTAASVNMTLTHTFVGDLNVVLAAPGGAPSLIIYKFTGATTATSFGFASDLVGTAPYNFADSASTNWWTAAAVNPVATGNYRTTQSGGAGQVIPAPVTSLNTTFGGLTPAQANGTWTLTFLDCGAGDTGSVTAANLTLTTGAGCPSPTPSPSGTPATPTPSPSTTPGTINCDTQAGIIIHDDNTEENGYSGNATTIATFNAVDKFTPTTYPSTFTSVCAAFITIAGTPTTLNYSVIVYDDDGPGGAPGTQLGEIADVAVAIAGGLGVPVWQTTDISSLGVTLTSGSVYIGVKYE